VAVCRFTLYVKCVGLAKTIHTYVYTVYIRYFEQGNHHTYGHIRCPYTVLANPKSVSSGCICFDTKARQAQKLQVTISREVREEAR